MKNVFAIMAVMAAAMSEAFRENKYRDAGMSLPTGRSRSRTPGKSNSAGAKQLIRYFKAKHGHKPENIQEARAWYAAYLADKDAAARMREAQRKAQRTADVLKLAA